MSIESRERMTTGMWVKGTSVHDERFRGYIDSVSSDGNVVKVRVILSDNSKAQGRVVEALRTKVEALPDNPPTGSEALTTLIDLALSTRDEAWFRELVALQRSAGAIPTSSQKGVVDSPASRLPTRW